MGWATETFCLAPYALGMPRDVNVALEAMTRNIWVALVDALICA